MNFYSSDKIPKFLKSKRGRGLSAGVIIGALAIVFSFQNCAKVKFSQIKSPMLDLASNGVPTVINDPPIVVDPPGNLKPTTRSLEINPKSTESSTSEKIRVLLVVDNSPTMKNSQIYLANNINKLLGYLQDYNVEVMVLSTDQTANIRHVPIEEPTPAGYSYSYHYKRVRNESIPTFSINKNASSADKSAQVKSISNYITKLGIEGNEAETPLGSVMLALDSTIGFFKKNDRALIYVITDEEDGYSLNHYGVYPIDHVEKTKAPECTGEDNPGTPKVVEMPGYKADFWSHSVSYYEKVEQFKENGDSRGFTDEYRTQSAYSAEGCEQAASYYRTGNYSQGTCHSYIASTGVNGLYGETLENRCANIKLSQSAANFVSCVAATYSYTEYVGATSQNCPYLQPEVSEKYLMDLTEQDKKEIYAANNNSATMASILYQKIKGRMYELFGNKFLMATQVHVKNQSCQPVKGQTVDTVFENLGKFYDKSNFSRNSICETESVDGDALNKVALQFQSVLSKAYPFALGAKESIQSVQLKIGQNSVDLKQNVDYKIENGSFVLMNTELNSFDKINVVISIAP